MSNPIFDIAESKEKAMRGLSLKQPWATLIALGAKKTETRSWSTRYRGPLAIHASKGYPQEAQQFCEDLMSPESFGESFAHASYHCAADLPLGTIVATATLRTMMRTTIGYLPASWIAQLDEHERFLGDFSADRYGWFLEDVHQLAEPIPCKGSLGLFTLPDAVTTAIASQIGGCNE